ncbi:recombinase family protein [Vibrio sp. 10N.286.49.F3]|uniref:recombinase family protein n=1 Tax=Vibrio sp. 10N.286.49.F3 TaxID=3229704 RepID=UPI0035528C6A
MSHRVGYIRVSSAEQNTDRQLADVQLDKVFVEKIGGGSTANRVVLRECMDYLREGDVLFVHSIDRLARNLLDLQNIIETLSSKGVRIEFVSENLLFYRDTDPMNMLTLQLLGAFAEFERKLIRMRQKEGMQAAKASGKHIGRATIINDELLGQVRSRISKGVNKSQIAKELHISRTTLYKVMDKLKDG